MNSTEAILRFLGFLSEVRTMFLHVHLDAEKESALRDVSTMVFPSKGQTSDYADEGVTLSVALNAELCKPADFEKQAIGMSLLLRHTGNRWIAEAEVGWTGRNVGWDPFDSKEAHSATVEEIYNAIPPLVEWMGMKFREEVAKLPK